MSEDFKPTGEQGQEFLTSLMLAQIGAERIKKKEMDVRNEVQKTGTSLVFARRKWEQWMAVADESTVNDVIDGIYTTDVQAKAKED